MPLFLSHRSGEEVVRLVARRLRIGKAALRNELRQHVELVHQLGVEDAAALVSRERPVAISRGDEGVPADQHRTGLLLRVEPQQKIGKADDRFPAFVATPPHRFRDTVIGAMRKRVAIDDEPRLGHIAFLVGNGIEDHPPIGQNIGLCQCA